MINNLRSMVAKVLYAPTTNQTSELTQITGNNPFDNNPFVQTSTRRSYGVNKPVKGGYFAGYYNGQPNIVGRRLFIMA